jgi:hypothetical protein
MAGASTPGSHQALRDAAGDLRKVIAYRLGRKEGIVDKWLLAPPVDAETRDANGIPNPLDHVIAIYHIVASDQQAKADTLLDWLCRQCGGRFVPAPTGQAGLAFDPETAEGLLCDLIETLQNARGPKRSAKTRAIRLQLQNLIDRLGIEEAAR